MNFLCYFGKGRGPDSRQLHPNLSQLSDAVLLPLCQAQRPDADGMTGTVHAEDKWVSHLRSLMDEED